MTKYLVTPINTVKRSIEEVTAGNLGVSILNLAITVRADSSPG
jgi:hypothetical protein